MDLGRDAEKAKNTVQGNMERAAEKTEQAYDNAKHEAKIKGSEIKEDIKNKVADIKEKWNNSDNEEENK